MRKLKPYSEYYFRVISRNIVGNSPPSESTPDIIRTEMAKPEYPPRDVAARPQNHTTLIINWEVSGLFSAASEHSELYSSQYLFVTSIDICIVCIFMVMSDLKMC